MSKCLPTTEIIVGNYLAWGGGICLGRLMTTCASKKCVAPPITKQTVLIFTVAFIVTGTNREDGNYQ